MDSNRPRSRLPGLLKEVAVRAYCLVILLLLLWTGYAAVAYLLHTVFRPSSTPPRLLSWPGQLKASGLRGDHVPGISDPAPRAPISHYHRTDRWFQPDGHNGCTVSGCHSPLPHTKRMRVGAFANFHTTFLTCQMCHENPGARPAAAAWVSNSGQPHQVPAILQLIAYLEKNQEQLAANPRGMQATIVRLLGLSLQAIGAEPLLEDLLIQLQNSEPGSPVWKHAMTILRAELPQHTRGEYRAKLTWQNGGKHYQRTQEMGRQARSYQAMAPGSPERRQLHQSIHAGVVAKPDACLSCHGDSPGLMDFAAAGYSPQRSKLLGSLELARLMQQIREGKEFYLPRIINPGDK